jgi:mRNA-degrading endonuclease RelE of RelBE toxin-antitoxin system
MQNDSDETKWTIGYVDDEHEKDIISRATSTIEFSKKWTHFVQDVTDNPHYHPKPHRIRKLKDSTFPKGTWRYRHDPIRVVYYPEGQTKIVYPLEVSSATDISYKKKSKK